MAQNDTSFLARLRHQSALRAWSVVADAAYGVDLPLLRQQRQRARQLKGVLDRLVHIADGRLARPRIGADVIERPSGTQWAWRPEIWRGPITPQGVAAPADKTPIGSQMRVYHDCKSSEITLRQIRNRNETDLAPFALRMDVFSFDGRFLSLVLDLPSDALAGMTRKQLVRLTANVKAEKEIELFARLNIKHGPNTEQLVGQLPVNQTDATVEFDLAYTDLNEKRIEKAWIDLIFEGPQMNQVVLHDLTLCHYPRASL